MNNLMENLNKEQFEAVTHKEGPLLIVAGAGTGKTMVITQKIAWMIEQGFAKTDEVLALTFTEKAAGEMEERVDRLLPMGYLDLWISTFHSFCERILRAEGLEIGLPIDFKLLNGTEGWLLVKKNLDKFDLDYYKPLGNATKFIHALLQHFSRAKDEVISPEEYLKYSNVLAIDLEKVQSNKEDLEQEVLRNQEIAKAYKVYQQLLLDNNYLDFGDLINYTLRLFKERPAILDKYQKQFKYVLVDEFQDTNWAQYELVKILASPRNNLTVVGDDDQAIFRFRGASMSNILQFKKDYPESKNVVLINNYRNKQNILDLSYSFIELNNPNRLEIKLQSSDNKLNKKLIAHSEGEGIIECITGENLEDEVRKVLEKIIEIKNSDLECNWNDFAILIRANDMANNYIPIMEREGIPYIFLASRGLYGKPIIMNIISYFKLLDNYHESSALYMVLSLPIFHFTQKELSDINYWASRKTLSIYEALKKSGEFGFSKEMIDKINIVLALIEKHTELAKEKGVAEVALQFLNDSGYLKYLISGSDQVVRDNTSILNQFYRRIQDFERNNDDRSVRNFVNELGMEIESGNEGSIKPDFESGPEAIKILTVHASKGLEFKYVFVVSLVDQRFPTIERKDPILLPTELIKEILPEGDIHLEEERRLFYVAITRAKEGIFFSWGKDYGGVRKKKPSRFLVETNMLSDEILKEHKIKPLSLDKENLNKNNNKKEKIEYQVPKHFSFSQLAAYDNCPKQYYFNFILKVPVQGKAQFSFGKTMHASLERVMELVISREKGKKFGEIISRKEMIDIFEASWVDDWYKTKAEKAEYFEKGKEIVRGFFDKYKDEIIKPVYLEEGFKFKIAGDEEKSFKGVIDRIDECEDGFKIVDYKTGKPKEKLALEDKKQLLIYQLASSQIFDKPIKKMSFYYLDDNTEVEFLGTEKELEKVEKSVTETIDQIKAGEFIAKPGMLCDFCDFANICENRKK